MMLMHADLFQSTFNFWEALFWLFCGIVSFGKAVKNSIYRRKCIVLGVVFVVFGMSDFVEMQTGAWWQPWWLFVWKLLCMISITFVGWLLLKKEFQKKHSK